MSDTSVCSDTFAEQLESAGCDERLIQKCSCLRRDRMDGPLRRVLEGHREELLDGLHAKQRQLDCCDRLMCSIGVDAARKEDER